jgi:hypothetical protein
LPSSTATAPFLVLTSFTLLMLRTFLNVLSMRRVKEVRTRKGAVAVEEGNRMSSY